MVGAAAGSLRHRLQTQLLEAEGLLRLLRCPVAALNRGDAASLLGEQHVCRSCVAVAWRELCGQLEMCQPLQGAWCDPTSAHLICKLFDAVSSVTI